MPDAFLLGVVSRLSGQKGLDLLLDSLPTILNGGMQLALLGDGEADLKNRFRDAAEAHPDQIGIFIGFDEGLAHLPLEPNVHLVAFGNSQSRVESSQHTTGAGGTGIADSELFDER